MEGEEPHIERTWGEGGHEEEGIWVTVMASMDHGKRTLYTLWPHIV